MQLAVALVMVCGLLSGTLHDSVRHCHESHASCDSFGSEAASWSDGPDNGVYCETPQVSNDDPCVGGDHPDRADVAKRPRHHDSPIVTAELAVPVLPILEPVAVACASAPESADVRSFGPPSGRAPPA